MATLPEMRNEATTMLLAIFKELDAKRSTSDKPKLTQDLKVTVSRDVQATLAYFDKQETEDARNKLALYNKLKPAQKKENLREYVLDLAQYHDTTAHLDKYSKIKDNPHLSKLLVTESTPAEELPEVTAASEIPVVVPIARTAPLAAVTAAPTIKAPDIKHMVAAIEKARRSSNTNELQAVKFIDRFWTTGRDEMLTAVIKESQKEIETGQKGNVDFALTRQEAKKLTRREWLKLTFGVSAAVLAGAIPLGLSITSGNYNAAADTQERIASGGDNLEERRRFQEAAQKKTPPQNQKPKEIDDFPEAPQRVQVNPQGEQELVPVNPTRAKAQQDAVVNRGEAQKYTAIATHPGTIASEAVLGAYGVGRVIYLLAKGPNFKPEEINGASKGMESIVRDAYKLANPRMSARDLEIVPTVSMQYNKGTQPVRGVS